MKGMALSLFSDRSHNKRFLGIPNKLPGIYKRELLISGLCIISVIQITIHMIYR